MVRCSLPALLALLASPLIIAQGDVGEYVIFIDNHQGSFLRESASQAPMSMDGVSAAMSALLDAAPALLNDEVLHSEVDGLLAPKPFARPEALLSLQVYDAQDEFPFGSENVAECCSQCPHHVRPLQETSEAGGFGRAVASLIEANSNNPAVVHSDLSCDALHSTCDAQCQEQVLEAFVGQLGGGYQRAAQPMGGLLTLEEGVVVELSSDPVQDLATELACLARAANHAWTATATSAQGAEESSQALPKKRHLLTGTLDSLAKVKATHGKDSNVYKAASKLMAKGIGMAKRAIRETFDGKLVGQVALLDSSKVGSPQRRHLSASEDSEKSYRDVDAWQSTAIMGIVGFSLVVITILCTICMCSMDLKQDTILYGRSKTE